MNSGILRGLFPLCLVVGLASVSSPQTSFSGLPAWRALGVSNDAAVAANSESSVGGLRWSSLDGVTPIQGVASGSAPSYVYGISTNGLVVVGRGVTTDRAIRWVKGAGTFDLGTLGGGGSSTAYGTSQDGGVVVGDSNGQAFRWTPADGMVALGFVPGANQSRALATSASGSTVVGYSQHSGTGANEAFRWRAGTMTGLGYLPGGNRSTGNSTSANGFVVVGFGEGGLMPEPAAFRWMQSTGMVNLGPSWEALSVSGDGNVIVGATRGPGTPVAYLWTPTTGKVDLKSYLLPRCGPSVSLWSLYYAHAVSADGKTIVGFGINPGAGAQAWMAKIEYPDVHSVSGNITFGGLDPAASVPSPVVFEYRELATGSVVKTTTAYLNASGNFTINAPPATGQYRLALKSQPWLRQTLEVDTTLGSVTGIQFVLINGDIDGDNEIGIGDYAVLSSSYGAFIGDPTWVPTADLNGDEYIDIADYAILSTNYGQVGDD